MAQVPPAENKMGTMPVGRLLAGMAVPMMLSMLFQALYNVVDSFWVAKLGQDALNAVSLAFPLQNLMFSLGGGTGVGMNALLSRSLGEKRQDLADRAANTGVFLFLCSGVVFCLIGLLFSGPFFRALTDNPQIIRYGEQYAGICLGLSFGLYGQLCFERLLQSTGRTVLSMASQLTGAIINMILDPILILGLFGAPRLEVAGAAIATVIGQFCAAALGLTLNLRKNREIHLHLRAVRWHGETAKEIYRVGFPSILMMSIGSVMNFFLNRILISFTEAATAVFGVYFKLQSFVFMPVFGLNNGMVPIVAYNYGAAREDRLRRTIRLTIITAVVIMSLGFLIFQLFPGQLMALFKPEDEAQLASYAEMLAIGKVALRIISLHFPLAGFCIIAGSVCQAIGNPFYSLIVSICRQLLVLLPAAWLLAQTGRLDLVWFAFIIAEGVSLLLSSIFLRRTMRAAKASIAARQSAGEAPA
ncbi:MAG: MATE family efflux transporter [Oscillibacter sp.]|nr:MATE family efflux transporter [Oscillibacter sp.]